MPEKVTIASSKDTQSLHLSRYGKADTDKKISAVNIT